MGPCFTQRPCGTRWAAAEVLFHAAFCLSPRWRRPRRAAPSDQPESSKIHSLGDLGDEDLRAGGEARGRCEAWAKTAQPFAGYNSSRQLWDHAMRTRYATDAPHGAFCTQPAGASPCEPAARPLRCFAANK